MLKEIKYQTDAVKQLAEKVRKLLDENDSRNVLVFQAPTGAGKTIIANMMLDELMSEIEEDDKEIAVIWIAPNKLHIQSYLKMKAYFSETRSLKAVNYEELDHSVSGYIKPGEVFFINWAKMNKDSNLIIQNTETSSSLFDLTRRTQERGIPIVVIIDEEHMFAGKNAKQAEEVLKQINPKVEIRMSATPTYKLPKEIVRISRAEVIKAQMIKNGVTINPKLKAPDNLSENEYLLDRAIECREKIKQEYEEFGVSINPLLLIQLPNDNNTILSQDEKQLIENIKIRLKNKYNITAENGRLAVWLSDEKDKENLDDLENPNNIAEVLLFKQAIALGWDCPRAAVLLIFRDIKSRTFGVQTVGRILRMPEQKHYPGAKFLNQGWVYTNLNSIEIIIEAEALNYISKPLIAKRQEGIAKIIALPSVYSDYLSSERNRIGSDFILYLEEEAKKQLFNNENSLFSGYNAGNGSENFEILSKTGYLPGIIEPAPQIVLKYREMLKNNGISLDVKDIHAEIPVDVDITEEANTYYSSASAKFAKTPEELKKVLVKYCAKLLTGFEKQCARSLYACICTFMGEMLGIQEEDVPKIILYGSNKPHFESVFIQSIENYREKIRKNKIDAKKRSFKKYQWMLPEYREYNENTNCIVFKDNHKHALTPYIRRANASSPEKDFESFLENNKAYIDWWYKNGDSGKQNFAVEYDDGKWGPSLFYVDYIITMKNGQVFLFDTKNPAKKDDNPIIKHNALIDYIAKNSSLALKGGIIIKKGENWMYSSKKIDTAEDLTEPFYPNKYDN